MKVHVVKQVDIEPKYKSLYLGNTEGAFTLTILEGSGHFIVNYDNQDLIELVHKERQITVKPMSAAGLIKITVIDAELPTAEPTHAHILISDIEKLSLWPPRSLMEQGDKMNLIVSAFDSKGDDFDVD